MTPTFARRFVLQQTKSLNQAAGNTSKPTLQYGKPAAGFVWYIEAASAVIKPPNGIAAAGINGPSGNAVQPINQARLYGYGSTIDEFLFSQVAPIPEGAAFPINLALLIPDTVEDLQMQIAGTNNTAGALQVLYVGMVQVAEYAT